MKIQNKLIMIFLCTVALLADREENTETEELTKEMIESYSQVFTSEKMDNRILLLPWDMSQSLFLLQKQSKKMEVFTHKKKSLSRHPTIEELTEVYEASLRGDKEVENAEMFFYLLSMTSQKNILHTLEDDLNKYDFSHEERAELLDSIEDLVILDKRYVSNLIKTQNQFYAKNVKKYFSIMKKKPVKNIVFSDEIYQEFLSYLNKGEELALAGVESNNFTSLDAFVESKLKLSDEEIDKFTKAFKKDPNETYLSTQYWSRVQVYIRYLKRGDSYYSVLIKNIKSQKELFEKLRERK